MIGRTALAGLILLVTACGPSATEAPTPTASSVERPAAPAARVGPVLPSNLSPDVPTARAQPQYLARNYQAPAGATVARRGSTAGTLRVPSLRIVAPVDAVGLDGGVMALPDNPTRIGWLRTTAAVGDRIGSSVLSGHVSDSHDRPGALSRLREVRPGTVITWSGVRGDRHRFVVTAIHRYPRNRGVPARLFRVTGPHLLHLVTCAHRVSTAGGGFHYTANLVVTAREVGR
ncbi:MAG: class F sortase [Propionibacteriales bacterium]|nr:class F sortase [Propionibacteriales bacterium]